MAGGMGAGLSAIILAWEAVGEGACGGSTNTAERSLWEAVGEGACGGCANKAERSVWEVVGDGAWGGSMAERFAWEAVGEVANGEGGGACSFIDAI